MIGDWEYESECIMAPGEPPLLGKGTERVRALGDVWVIGEASTSMPDGSPANMQITLGYDTARQRFTGTFVGSMMTNLWVYDGQLDEAGQVLTLNAEGPTMTGEGMTGEGITGEGMAKYQDIVELRNDDHRVLRSRVMQDGQWVEFMTANYRRKA